MKEIETPSFLFTLNHLMGKIIILFTQIWDIFRSDRVVFGRWCHDRFHRDLVEAKIREMQDIFGEIKVPVRICSAHIVGKPELISHLSELQEFGKDEIVTALPFSERPHSVMNFLSPVDGENHIVHLPVAEFHDLIIKKHAVGRQSKTEFLRSDCIFRRLLEGSAVGNKFLHDFPVHKWLSAEKVHLKVRAHTGILYQEIQRFLSDLSGHEGSASVVLSLFGKAVTAGKITVVGNVKTKRFDDCRPLCKLIDGRSVRFRRKQRTFSSKFLDLLQNFLDLAACRIGMAGSQSFSHSLRILGLAHISDSIIKKVIRDMDRSARNVKDDSHTFRFILMNLHNICYSIF